MWEMMYFEKKFNLRTCDFDGRDTIKISACLDFFQEIAAEHSNIMGSGYLDLIKNNEMWILVRQRITILKKLEPNSTIKVETWPKKQNKLYFNRDYRIIDESGEVCVIGNSVWVVSNYVTRKLVRVRENFYNSDIYYEEDVYDKPTDKLKFSTLEKEENPFIHTVENSHLDHNGHMNNRIYADIALNMIDLKEKKIIKDFVIEFVHEALNHEQIISYKFSEGSKTYFYGYVNGNISYRIKAEYEEKI